MKHSPEGMIGETVGIHDGWSSSKVRLVKIVRALKTKVTVEDTRGLRHFSTRTWAELGSNGSRYASTLLSKEAAERMIEQDRLEAARKDVVVHARKSLSQLDNLLNGRSAPSMDSVVYMANVLKDAADQAAAMIAEINVNRADITV